jgi:hypothetical protein
MTDSVLRDLAPARIDYSRIMADLPEETLPAAKAFLAEELPYVWLDAYVAVMPHEQNVQRVTIEGFEYLFDFSAGLVSRGSLTASEAVEDRLVAAHGESRSASRKRNDSRLKGRQRGPVDAVDRTQRAEYDRGHAIAHASGGVLDVNIVPQIASVNRRGLWREMERYCQHTPGTYLFCRALYAGLSPHPAELELGVLKPDLTLWVETFKNYGSLQELEQIERVYLAKVQAMGELD